MKRVSLFIVALGFVLSALAQNTGRIDGLVTDTSGVGLKGAKIDILDASGALTGRDITTNTNGSYALINLAPGRYDLKYSYSGCCTIIVHGVIVTADNETEVNLQLHHCSGQEIETITYERPFQNRMPYYFKK